MIRVLAAEAAPITFRLREGYRIAGASFSSADNVIVKIDTADGRTGFGCAAPAAEVTGETPAACLTALRDRLIPMLRGSDAADLAGIEQRALEIAPVCPAARAALDTALHDLLGQRAGQPLARVLGARRGRLLTSVTLGISEDPAATLDRARRYAAEGFKILKLKVGEDWRADAGRVRALRELLGPGVLIRADGNQGYTEEQARSFLGALPPDDLELLEQPTSAADPEALGRLARDFDVPIMADEAVLDEEDARLLVAEQRVDLLNIKLMKCGGVRAALRIGRIVERAGLGAMIGCNDESRIGIAAGLHAALAAPGVELADLDGHLDLLDDVARGGVRIEDGYILPEADAPGLGVSVDF
jgi:L-alanine-DL-glutamate epimerase-like enolase superfamily enzyme